MTLTPTVKWASSGLGATLGALGLYLGLLYVAVPVNPFDEGILLTHSWLLSQGFLPHRDFYTNYPPGIYLLIATAWRLVGTSPWVLRWATLGLRLAVALLAGRLAGAALGRGMALIVPGLVLLWLGILEPIPAAWLAGQALALATFQLWLWSQSRPGFLLDFIVGLSLSGISCFRYDLLLTLGGTLALLGLIRRRMPPRARVAAFTLGALVPFVLVWLPLVARVGWRLVLQDLVLDQVRYVEPGRQLPLPLLLTPAGGLPALLAQPLSGAVALTLAGPLVAAVLWLTADALGIVDRRPLALLGALALANVPHVLSRADEVHSILSVAPSLALIGTLAVALASRVRSSAVAVAVLTVATTALVMPLGSWIRVTRFVMPALPTGPPPYDGLPATRDRLSALDFVTRHTKPAEAIYVGLTQHRRIFTNEVDFYFFARRPGVTRYLQFDPNMQNRGEVQRRMIGEIEARRPRLAVLSSCCQRDEPNDSHLVGSGDLDAYLRQRYRVVALIGGYEMLWRADLPFSP